MRNPFHPTLQIHISWVGLTLARAPAWQRPSPAPTHVALTGEVVLQSEHLTAALDGALTAAQHRGGRVSVTVADDLVRYFMVTPPVNTARLDDCRAAAAMRFQALYGEAANQWSITADWHVHHPFLACAMPQSLLTTLQRMVTSRRLTLTGMVPTFIDRWNTWHHRIAKGAWFGCVADHVVSLAIIDAGRLCAVLTTALPAWPDQAWFDAYLAREALRLNLAVPQRLLMCGEVPPAWLEPLPGRVACQRIDVHPHGGSTPASTPDLTLVVAQSTVPGQPP